MRTTQLKRINYNRLRARMAYALAGTCLAALICLISAEPTEAQNLRSSVNNSEYRIAARSRIRFRHSYRHSYRRRKSIQKRKKVIPPIIPAWLQKSEQSKDPVQIIISLPQQSITVYKGSEIVVTSRVSSGKPGYASPAGVFSILQKSRTHRSNIYSAAPMPYMQRLTWSGIALHGSDSVPDYPASHGCIRLPHSFALQLFKYTGMGGHVIVANENIAPVEIAHDTLFQPTPRALQVVAKVETTLNVTDAQPMAKNEKRSTAPLRILITRRNGQALLMEVQELLNEISFNSGKVDGLMGPITASAIHRFQSTYGLRPNGLIGDELVNKLYEVAGKGIPKNGHMYVRQNFNSVFDAPVMIRGGDKPLGSHLYTAMHFEPNASTTRWLGVTLTKGSPQNTITKLKQGEKEPSGEEILTAITLLSSTALEALDRIEITPEIRQRISKMLNPGSSLAITNDGISKETTPKGSDFVLLMQ